MDKHEAVKGYEAMMDRHEQERQEWLVDLIACGLATKHPRGHAFLNDEFHRILKEVKGDKRA